MASLDRLPPELLLHISRSLELGDQLQLSTTCRRLRETAIHEWKVFTALSFSARSKESSDSALAVARRHGDTVRELAVVVRPPPQCEQYDDDELGSDGSDVSPMLPTSAVTLLQGNDAASQGRLLPKLQKIVVQFPKAEEFEFDSESEECAVSIYISGDGQVPGLADANNAMVDLILDSLATTAYPMENAISLSIFNLPPHNSSVFETAPCCNLLGRLEDFELSLFGEADDYNGTFSCGDMDYIYFVANLRRSIFSHLTSVKKLKLHGSTHAPLGFRDSARLPLVPAAMPLLDHLELRKACVGWDLIKFVERHAAKFRRPLSFRLIDVAADSEGLTWGVFFMWLLDTGITIQDFSLTYMNDGPRHSWKPATRARRAKELLMAHPERIVFPYVFIDPRSDDFGNSCVLDEYLQTERFLSDTDQLAYQQFMRKVPSASVVREKFSGWR